MHSAASRCPAPPVTPPSSRSPSPPIIPSTRRRRLWSPPMRRRSPTTSRSRSSASSTAPRLAHRPPRPSPDAADVADFRPPSRSQRQGHRSHHDSRPPSTTSRQRDAEVVRGRPRRQSPSPSPSPSPSASPSSARTQSPPMTPPAARRLQSVLQRPPRTQHGNRGSTSVASSLLSSARKRAQARPPTPTDIRRVNRKLCALAL